MTLQTIRRWYADDLRLRTPVVRNPSVIEAFATVARERFLGPGPWTVVPFHRPKEPFTTPDDAPHWLYHDILVAIDPTRDLNNGQPSFWAHNFDHLDLRPGERVLQIGAGTGYYSAILAEIVGSAGRVTAVEFDADLAARARTNLAPWAYVDVVAGDGRLHDAGEVDAVVAFAGSTHPPPLWLDRLADNGRLMMPLTSENRWGFMLRATRQGSAFAAASIGWVGIFPCIGGRDPEAAQRLEEALKAERGSAGTKLPIHALHRGEPADEALHSVWYRAPGFWLERGPDARPQGDD